MTLLVVQLSDSFSELWRQLGEDLAGEVRGITAGEARAISSDVGAVLLAAGGVERQATEWLDRHEVPAGVPILVVGADPSRRTAVTIVARGASDYFAMPDDVEILRNSVLAALARRANVERQGAQRPVADGAFAAIVGESPALRAVLERAGRLVGHPDATALIMGETGTGKELLARAIHRAGPRRGAPFVPVNCSALPRELIESELFGHERGAFIDAHAAKPGLFEIADGGTLFLDEIGTLPIALQAKLLRALEDKEIRRVGATKTRLVNVRIIAATNENLEQATRDGRFREDLYYRIGVVTLVLPPLRERGTDVLLIAEQLLERLARQHGLPAPELDETLSRALVGYHWPGNVRELKNAVERALLLSPPGQLSLEELVPRGGGGPSPMSPLPFPAELTRIESAAAHAMLATCGGNRSEAARRLGVSRRRLRRLLGLVPESF